MAAHSDRFGCGKEKPSSTHRHHGVPHQTDHRTRYVELPKSLPLGEAVHAGCFIEVTRLGDEGVVEAERHVPGLGGEDREDARGFEPEGISEEPQEEYGREWEEPEDRDRLEDVEERYKDLLCSSEPGSSGCVDECEERR